VPQGVEVSTCATAEDALRCAAEFDVAIGARVGGEFLDAARNLKYLVIPFAGIPARDMEILRAFARVRVLNSHFNAAHVAEHAWALLLASVKRLCPIHEKFKRGDWTARYGHVWSDALAGGCLLILGYGAVGRAIAGIAGCLRVRVRAVKRTPGSAPEIESLGGGEDLHAFLPWADFIIVALPGTARTRGLLGRREFELMKQGVHVVNVGRGEVIDEEAFYGALKSGKVAGAAIDAWWVYPGDEKSRSCTAPSRYPFHEFENVVFSPHRASHVRGREEDRIKDLARILASIAAGAPVNVMDLNEGY
jgi:phosphoglycerate dehydrogenase-like enzyme